MGESRDSGQIRTWRRELRTVTEFRYGLAKAINRSGPRPIDMPTYLDIHVAGKRTGKGIQSAVGDKPDKFGVSHVEFFINEKEDKMLCFHEAPDEEAVRKHHEAVGLKCDWIIKVDRIS